MSKPVRQPEEFDAVRLAERILDRPFGDPDDDLALLARQFLRARKRSERRVKLYELARGLLRCETEADKVGLMIAMSDALAELDKLEGKR